MQYREAAVRRPNPDLGSHSHHLGHFWVPAAAKANVFSSRYVLQSVTEVNVHDMVELFGVKGELL